MQKGLRKSMKSEWSGDVEFGDGEVQARHAEYVKRLAFVQNLNVGKTKNVY
jgi:hypothetical protein